ncbi:Curved DNA-binding protein [Desulfovibrionales bacterium]
MNVTYKDYYKLLKVSKLASQEEIAKAFKKLARKYHPDLNPKDKQAEKNFKEINEAYIILKDPEKRKLYDQLDPNWQHGQNFQPPPGFENIQFDLKGNQTKFNTSGFSDFFETLLSGTIADADEKRFQHTQDRITFGRQQFEPRSRRGHDAVVSLNLTLEEAYCGGVKAITLTEQTQGQMPRVKILQVTIPKGVKDKTKIRLTGQGNPGISSDSAGDLFLKVHILKHHRFYLNGQHVMLDLPLTSWEAALGVRVRVPTLEGEVELTIPAGVSSGHKLRLPGLGLGVEPRRGDQLIQLMIVSQHHLNNNEKRLWEQLAATSTFKARDF